MRVVSFGMMLPDERMGNAGGQFYAHHVRALQALGHEVVVIAPEGLYRTQPTPVWYPSIGILPAHRFHFYSGPGRLLNRLLLGGVRPAYRRRVLADPRVREAVRRADAVEYQWCEFGTLARSVERLRERPGPSWLVVHDELVQREARAARGAHGWRRAVLTAGGALVLARERAVFRRMTALLTISEKDAAQCRRVLPGVDAQVVAPPVVERRGEAEPPDERTDRVPDRVLFVGAMARKENEAGALWFLRHVWPAVVEAVPAARLRIAGSHPSERLIDAADDTVTITGFVEDLDAEYLAASVVVVPLHEGAGVKFKTIAALAHGLPVVTTSVGREGIFEGEDTAFAAVADGPAAFAAATIEVLRRPPSAHSGGQTALRTVQRFGTRSYADRLGAFVEHAAVAWRTTHREAEIGAGDPAGSRRPLRS